MERMKRVERKRLDELLVDQGLCVNRTQAKAYILAGQVRLDTERLDKANKLLPLNSNLTVLKPMKYVGRGGLKMENFLETSKIEVSGLRILDLGASTGGFTDCLLQKGVREATCLDVGHGQLHYKLRNDHRVSNFEKLNVRNLSPAEIPGSPFPLVVMDLSFISLKKVLRRAWNFVEENGKLITLVKPQFECTRKEASEAKGVIRNPEIQTRVKQEILSFVSKHLKKSKLLFHTDALPRGTDGNLEFFVAWEKGKTEFN